MAILFLRTEGGGIVSNYCRTVFFLNKSEEAREDCCSAVLAHTLLLLLSRCLTRTTVRLLCATPLTNPHRHSKQQQKKKPAGLLKDIKTRGRS